MGRLTSPESCNAIFAALSEYKRLLDRADKKGKYPSLTALLKKNNVGRNYHSYIKQILENRRIIEHEIKNGKIVSTKWREDKAIPNYVMAESIAKEASKMLVEYQRNQQKKRDAKKRPDLLEGVEISPNPQRLEHDILEGEKRNPLFELLDEIDPFVIMEYLKEKASKSRLGIEIKLK